MAAIDERRLRGLMQQYLTSSTYMHRDARDLFAEALRLHAGNISNADRRATLLQLSDYLNGPTRDYVDVGTRDDIHRELNAFLARRYQALPLPSAPEEQPPVYTPSAAPVVHQVHQAAGRQEPGPQIEGSELQQVRQQLAAERAQREQAQAQLKAKETELQDKDAKLLDARVQLAVRDAQLRDKHEALQQTQLALSEAQERLQGTLIKLAQVEMERKVENRALRRSLEQLSHQLRDADENSTVVEVKALDASFLFSFLFLAEGSSRGFCFSCLCS